MDETRPGSSPDRGETRSGSMSRRRAEPDKPPTRPFISSYQFISGFLLTLILIGLLAVLASG